MIAVLSIITITCVFLVVCVLSKPSINVRGRSLSVYWLIPLLGALLLIACQLVSPGRILSALTENSSVNPIKILVLFLSMTFLSIYLDEAGFFRYLADASLRRAGYNGSSLFLMLYITVSLLTVFTSNDIIILTFTPFICCFSKNAGINPLPYLFTEFIAANTWSMMFLIGNPTNIYLAAANGIGFFSYFSIMFLPTIFAGVVSFLLLYLFFHRQLRIPLSIPNTPAFSPNRPAIILGLIHLGVCTTLLTISSYIGVDMWLASLSCAISLFICSIILRLCKTKVPTPFKCLRRAPWELIPFVLSMFVLVLAAEETSLTSHIAALLSNDFPILTYGISSFFTGNLVNNIPMSVLFSAILRDAPASASLYGVYASIIGSNLCAFFTPIGALAGIMWTNIMKTHKVSFRVLSFLRYGAPIALCSLLAALGGLAIRLY